MKITTIRLLHAAREIVFTWFCDACMPRTFQSFFRTYHFSENTKNVLDLSSFFQNSNKCFHRYSYFSQFTFLCPENYLNLPKNLLEIYLKIYWKSTWNCSWAIIRGGGGGGGGGGVATPHTPRSLRPWWKFRVNFITV
jgi:hypothetical protein